MKFFILGSLAFFTLFCVFTQQYYANTARKDNTLEVWRNLGFITYPQAKTYFEEDGVDVNSRGTDGQTFLMVASEFGMQNTAKIMIDFGANVNAKDNKGETALQIAQQSRNRDMVSILLKHGAQ